jgi:vancomycin resistance protein YoaR
VTASRGGPEPDETTLERAPESDAERTEGIPRDTEDTGPAHAQASRGRRTPVLVGAAVVGLLAVLYVGDLLISSTDVPRGVVVAGVSVGGMGKPEAEAALREQLQPRLTRPVTLQAGTSTAILDPRAAGLALDVDGTLARAGEQPFNPWTRLTSLFTTREVAPATAANAFTVGQALDGTRAQLDRAPTEGTIRFEGTEPVAVPSVPGRVVDGPEGVAAVTEHWLDPTPVVLPVTGTPVSVTPQGLQTALDEVARPAMAGPLTVVGDRKNATVTPEAIATFLTFRPDGSGGLEAGIDEAAARAAVGPQLASTEAPPRDATLAFAGTTSSVVPGVVGRAVDWPRTVAGLVQALAQPVGAAPPVYTPPPTAPGVDPPAPPAVTGRAVNAAYTTTPPKVTTEELTALGPVQVIGEFTTRGFAPDSGQNIRRVAEIINGTTIAPNSVFSLNRASSPRDAAHGFVDAGIIDDGAPGRGVGGGTSQFATTLYNASYFAGLDDVEHKEHSYPISRYPAGREATVFEGSIDLKIGNSGDTPVFIRTEWTPSSITVQLYGQKRYDVTSQQGPRFAPVEPGTRDLGTNPQCKPSTGVAGFSITDTRTLRDVRTGQVRTQPRTVRYEPQPTVTCNNR